MKKIYFIIIIMGVLTSCSDKNEIDDVNYSEIWQLSKMIVSSVDGETTIGGDMEWQESYILNIDGTFIKSRWLDEEIIQANGIFKYKNVEGENYIEFIYDVDNELIGNCTPELKETLIFNEKEYMLKSTWQNCDGPELEYHRLVVCGTGL